MAEATAGMAVVTLHTTGDHIAEIRVQKRVWGHTHGECVGTLTFFQMEGRVAIRNDCHDNTTCRHEARGDIGRPGWK